MTVQVREEITNTKNFVDLMQLEAVVVSVDFGSSDFTNHRLVILINNGRAWTDAHRTNELFFQEPIQIASPYMEIPFYVDSDGVAGAVQISATVEHVDPFLQEPPEEKAETFKEKLFKGLGADRFLHGLPAKADAEIHGFVTDGMSPVTSHLNALIDERINEINADPALLPNEKQEKIGHYNTFRSTVDALPNEIANPFATLAKDTVEQGVNFILPKDQPAEGGLGQMFQQQPTSAYSIQFNPEFKNIGDIFDNEEFQSLFDAIRDGNLADADDFIFNPTNYLDGFTFDSTITMPGGYQWTSQLGVAQFNDIGDWRKNQYKFNLHLPEFHSGVWSIQFQFEALLTPQDPTTGNPDGQLNANLQIGF